MRLADLKDARQRRVELRNRGKYKSHAPHISEGAELRRAERRGIQILCSWPAGFIKIHCIRKNEIGPRVLHIAQAYVDSAGCPAGTRRSAQCHCSSTSRAVSWNDVATGSNPIEA